MISAEHLTVTLNGRAVVRDVSFWLNTGEMAALVGPNGAGKSTVLKALSGCCPQAARFASAAPRRTS